VANQPGHHPPEEQDKPNLDAFAERLGITDEPAAEAVPRQLAPTEEAPAKRPTMAIAGAAFIALLAAVLVWRRRRS
jgi:MYXO-CTERM domain-containing protein